MSPAPTTTLPETLEPELSQAMDYWKDLIRGENPMPFSDDLDLSRLPGLSPSLMLLTAFAEPDRFRFETAGERIVDAAGSPLVGEFSDEVKQSGPLEAFTEQCRMTVAQRAPTYFRSASDGQSRLLLPTWGDGHVLLLLGVLGRGS